MTDLLIFTDSVLESAGWGEHRRWSEANETAAMDYGVYLVIRAERGNWRFRICRSGINK